MSHLLTFMAPKGPANLNPGSAARHDRIAETITATSGPWTARAGFISRVCPQTSSIGNMRRRGWSASIRAGPWEASLL